jgi:hypothetical protein
MREMLLLGDENKDQECHKGKVWNVGLKGKSQLNSPAVI